MKTARDYGSLLGFPFSLLDFINYFITTICLNSPFVTLIGSITETVICYLVFIDI